MKSFDNVDTLEIEKFDRVSQMWWDPKSEMGTLHTINPLRTRFIMERLTTPNPRILGLGMVSFSTIKLVRNGLMV